LTQKREQRFARPGKEMMDRPTQPLATRAPSIWRRLYTDMSFQVIVAMLAGVALGLFLPDIGVKMQPLGDAFVRLIRMLVAPIIFCTVVHGIVSMGDLKRVGRVALKSIIYFEAMTTLALVFGLVLVNVWKPGVGMNIDLHALNATAVQGYVAQAQHRTIGDFLMGIIPQSAVGAFAEGNLLAVLFFSVLFAISLSIIGERAKPVFAVIESVNQALFASVRIVMWAAPIGAFGSIAFTVGRFGGGALIGLGSLILCFYATCLLFIIVCMGLVARLSGFSLLKFIRYIREELLVVLATTTTETVLPRLMGKLERLGCDEAVVGLSVPASYSFNLEGTCLYATTVAVFLAQATNTPFGLEQQIGLVLVALLTAKGSAGVAGSAFISFAGTLSVVGTIPIESIALVIGIHRLMSEALTFTTLLGNGVATIAIAKWEGALNERQMNDVLDQRAPMLTAVTG
jgi:aerobic C4-dicarboxylate transport protein